MTVHHHLVPIPGTGRERNIVLDAGHLLLTLVDLDVDLVLSGHKHVPFFWGLNGTLICNSAPPGPVACGPQRRRRGTSLRIDASTIKVFTHDVDGPEPAASSPSSSAAGRARCTVEPLYVTDADRTSNQIGRLAGT